MKPRFKLRALAKAAEHRLGVVISQWHTSMCKARRQDRVKRTGCMRERPGRYNACLS
jgi:hypothetical protein